MFLKKILCWILTLTRFVCQNLDRILTEARVLPPDGARTSLERTEGFKWFSRRLRSPQWTPTRVRPSLGPRGWGRGSVWTLPSCARAACPARTRVKETEADLSSVPRTTSLTRIVRRGSWPGALAVAETRRECTRRSARPSAGSTSLPRVAAAEVNIPTLASPPASADLGWRILNNVSRLYPPGSGAVLRLSTTSAQSVIMMNKPWIFLNLQE